jgi:two-component system, sporulation sensor kinase A
MDRRHLDDQILTQDDCYKSCRLVCSDAIITTDVRGILNSYNQGAQELFGYSAADVIGKPLCKLLKGGDEEGRRIQRLLEERDEVRLFDSEVIGKNQRNIPVRVSACLLRDASGGSNGMIAIWHDLRPLRHLEAEIQQRDQFLASIVRNSADAIFTLDRQERVTSWNKGAEDVFGYTEEEMLGQTLEVLIPQELVEERELEKISQIARREGFLRSYRTRRIAKDGQLLDVIFTRTAIRDQEGNLLGFSSVVKDVTQQRLIERHLAQMEKLSAIGEVAAGLAHEIKNPLAGIKGAIEIIRDGLPEDQPNKMILGEVLTEVARIDRIVMDLLSYSKPRKPDFVKTDLLAIIRQVISFVQNVADAKGICLALHEDGEIQPITGDENELKQLFMNLILNSVEVLTNKGRVSITVKETSDSTLSVEVADNGPGIPRDQLDKIFQPFFTTKKHGTGLGLATCKRVVLDHGGEIRAESEIGKGTCFRIDFPLSFMVPTSLSLR